MKIYVVFGMTGDYDDARDWDVKAFKSKRRAEAFRTKLQGVACQFNSSSISDECSSEHIESLLKLAGDEHASVDYNGTSYGVFELELVA